MSTRCEVTVIIKVDAPEVVNLIQNSDNERSIYASLLLEIKTLMSSRQTCITQVNHSQNTVRHSLTNYARIEGITVVRSGPAKTDDLCNKRCKPDSD